MKLCFSWILILFVATRWTIAGDPTWNLGRFLFLGVGGRVFVVGHEVFR